MANYTTEQIKQSTPKFLHDLGVDFVKYDNLSSIFKIDKDLTFIHLQNTYSDEDVYYFKININHRNPLCRRISESQLSMFIFELLHLGYLQNIDIDVYNKYIEQIYGV